MQNQNQNLDQKDESKIRVESSTEQQKQNKFENQSQRQQSNIFGQDRRPIPYQPQRSSLSQGLYRILQGQTPQIQKLNDKDFQYMQIQFEPFWNCIGSERKNGRQNENAQDDSDQQEQEQIFAQKLPNQNMQEQQQENKHQGNFLKQKIQSNTKKSKRKNIIKNFGRNTIKFVERSSYIFNPFLQKHGKNYLDFLPKLKKQRKKINTIKDLRNLWINEDKEYASLMRSISQHFFRKKALSYVFNSKIKEQVLQDHLICIKILRRAVKQPECFTNLSDN